MLRHLLACLALVTICSSRLVADEPANYGDDLRFLSEHTKVLELKEGESRVAICPEWQGRVMTSTCEGADGASFGWLNREFIAKGEPSKAFNNYGGEDRFWISPEAGQFGFFFEPKTEQKVANWITPPGLNEGRFSALAVHQGENVRGYVLSRDLSLTNYSGQKFDLEVNRRIRLVTPDEFAKLFGEAAAEPIREGKLRYVGFASDNAVTNRGAALARKTGLLSIWTLGQFKPGAKTVIIAPFATNKGTGVTPDYFGPVPEERLVVTDMAVLFLGDGKFRAKLGIAAGNAKPVAGSYDFENHALTLVAYTLPADAGKMMYINNRWELPLAEPYVGDAFNSYNDGPAEPGAATLGGFYELETLSPTLELEPHETLTHTHRTLHLTGDEAALAAVAKAVLGVDLADVRKRMFGE